MLDDFEDGEFDGIILSNVLDVMPEQVDETVLKRLDRVLAPGGYWFIKLNPYYTAKELRELDYESEGSHLYEEDVYKRQKSEGSFLYAAEIVKAVELGRFNLKDVDNFPVGLTNIYLQWKMRKKK